MTKEYKEELIKEAIKARENAYAPYSHFMVGAVLVADDGTLYHGCNIENGAYSPSNCAERTAFFKAISEGKRSFLAIAIVGGEENSDPKEWNFCPPCGVCRQVMAEFCDEDTFEIVLCEKDTVIKSYVLKELLPLGFSL